MPIAPEVYKKIVKAKVYIDENFRESRDLDRLSREACLSRYHFRDEAWRRVQQTIRQPRSFIPHCFLRTVFLTHPSIAGLLRKAILNKRYPGRKSSFGS